MARFVVFDPETGTILRTGACQDGMAEYQARAGEGVLTLAPEAPPVGDATHRVIVAGEAAGSIEPIPQE